MPEMTYNDAVRQRVHDSEIRQANSTSFGDVLDQYYQAKEQRDVAIRIENLETELVSLQNNYRHLQDNYRIQTDNVSKVKGTAGAAIAQTQTAVNIIMELTGKSFDDVRETIMDNTKESSYSKIKKWLETVPKNEFGLINHGRMVLDT